MKRLRRIILSALTVLSVVLCMASGVMWARSCWFRDTWSLTGASRYSIESSGGAVSFNHYSYAWKPMFAPENAAPIVPTPVPYSDHWTLEFTSRAYREYGGWAKQWSAIGFDYGNRGFQFGHGGREFVPKGFTLEVPYWLPLLLTAVVVARIRLIQRKALRLESAGICGKCGYDLRATPERCPECGAIPAKGKA